MHQILIKIKEELKKQKITYSDFAKKTKIAESTLKHIFSGAVPNPRIDTINIMLENLGLNEYEKTPQGTYLTELEQDILDLVTQCSEQQQMLTLSYISGLLDNNNIGYKNIDVPDQYFNYNKNK